MPAGSKLLTSTRVDGAEIRLVETSAGRLAALVRTKSGETVALQQEESGLHPIRGWVDSMQVVAGVTPEIRGPRYEVLTAEGKVIKGKLGVKWFIVTWPSSTSSPRYLFRILDGTGTERYRWPPPGRSPVASMILAKENVA